MKYTGKLLKLSVSCRKVVSPKKRIRVKPKKLMNPWVTKRIAKSSKKKQKLYEKILKKRNPENEKINQSYKVLCESITRKSKKLYYSEKLLKLQRNAK